MSFCRTAILVSFALAACPPTVSAGKPACNTGTIQTSSGPVCGVTSTAPIAEGKTASAYRGIPYAVPPIGPLRWQYSTLFKGSAPLQATTYGSQCPQTVASAASTESGSRCANGQILGSGQSEDCLYLNVWVPDGATAGSRLPVMVFIHGGAFSSGSSSAGMPFGNLYDGTYLAAVGKVIVVTFNYRLGALGFLARDGNHNFGFADQLLALQWVQMNIANFGGDPKNVTLFGESAGAKSVGLHALVSPKSAGLFHAAIMESNALGLPYKSISQAERLGAHFCKSTPSPCTTATTACDLVRAQNDFMAAQPLSFATITNFLWAPTVDNVYITGQPIASAANLSMPLLLGTNHDEGTVFVYQAESLASKSPSNNPPDAAAYAAILDRQFGRTHSEKIQALERYHCGTSSDCTRELVNVMTDFAFACANRHLAIEATRRTAPPPLYIYLFKQVSSFNFWAHAPQPVPECKNLVCHGAELPYVFNSAWQFRSYPGLISFTWPEELLARAIGGYWTSFASSRNPGRDWPLFQPDRTYLRLSERSSTAKDPLDVGANCSALWDGIGYGVAQPDR